MSKKKKKNKIQVLPPSQPRLRNMSFVRVAEPHTLEYLHSPLIVDRAYVFLGEHPNMLGHGAFLDTVTKMIFPGRHLDGFEELPENVSRAVAHLGQKL